MSSSEQASGKRADALANRLIQGARSLAEFASGLSEAAWNTPVTGDGRPVGVVVHHVASVYPVEVELAQVLASGSPITGVTMEVINTMNAEHARNNAAISKEETLELLEKNSKAAAEAIRRFSDEALENAATVSLYGDAPLTAQFFIEDHALRHSFHHLSRIRKTLDK